MNAIPIQASSRYGGRDSTASRLPPISTSRHDDLPGPFAPSSSSIPPADALSTSGGPNPMAIPGADKKMDNVPPPLPPPPLVPIDGPVDPNLYARYGNRDRDALAFSLPRGDLPARDAGIDASQDVGSPSDRRSSAFPPPLGYSAMKGFRRYDNSIDSSMLDKLNRPGRRHGLSASFNDLPDHRPSHTQIPTYSLPHRPKQSFLDSTFARSPGAMSATSPIGAPFSHAGGSSFDHRLQSVADSSDFERSPLPRSQRAHNGYETRDDDADFPMEETSRMRGLKIDDPWRERDWDRDRDWDREREKERDGYQAGQKRRASSPLGDEVALANDVLRRRDGGPISRGSPTPRLLVTPQNSLSSVSSMSRSGSYTSNLTASSVTSIGSFGRRSPNALSPSGLSPTEPLGGSSPYPAPPGVSASPRPSMGQGSAAPSPRQQAPSEQPVPLQTTRTVVSPRKLAEIPQNPSGLAAKLKGPYMCECCPKKPKKFETEEELRAHEAEKQYECSFCGNRFKNKNEAERHQNSLHVRSQSWSCSALTGYERAFHESTVRPGEADVCGYCGEEFPRTGKSQGGLCVSEQDWEGRVRHLQDVHKFRECNASKKFYRADHFRQHLKHSHAGTSGKWTNMLENACMMEEQPAVGTR